jgi:acyl carrier protein
METVALMTDATPTTAVEIRRRILDFIHLELVAEEVEVGPEDDLLSGELLDSVSVLRLATFVDETFAIGMKPTDFLVENFQNAAVLADYVERSTGGRGSAS